MISLTRIGVSVAFLSVLFYVFPKIRFENQLDRWIPQESEAILQYQKFLEKYGSDAFVIITFYNEQGLDQAGQKEQIGALYKALTKAPYLKHVYTWPLPAFRLKAQPNKKTKSFIVTFDPPSHTDPNRPETLEYIVGLLGNINIESHIAGTGVLHREINELTRKSTAYFLGLGMLMLCFLLVIIVRRPGPFLKTIGVSVGGVSSLLICSVLFGIPLNIISTILPILVLFYSTSNSLHILFHRGDIKKVIIPCLLTALTTAAGFVVFLFQPIPLLRDFSILAIAGITGGLLWTFILFSPAGEKYVPPGWLTKRFLGYSPAKSKLVILLFGAIMGGSIPGVIHLKTDFYSLAILPQDNPRVKDIHFIQDNVSNYIPLEYSLTLKENRAREVNNWIKAVLELEEISGAVSYLDFRPFYLAKDYGYTTEQNTEGRITFLAPVMPTNKAKVLVDKIDSLARKEMTNPPPGVSGYVTLYAEIASELSSSFVKSLTLTFCLVFVIMALYFREFKIFAASILPNLFPILVMLGIMGYLNIRLDMVTVPIGCLLLSIIVDDTIHFLYWFKKTRDFGNTYRKAGPGILMTSITLGMGFSVFLFSSSPPIRYFGLLSITSLTAALISDVILLPSLLNLMRKK